METAWPDVADVAIEPGSLVGRDDLTTRLPENAQVPGSGLRPRGDSASAEAGAPTALICGPLARVAADFPRLPVLDGTTIQSTTPRLSSVESFDSTVSRGSNTSCGVCISRSAGAATGSPTRGVVSALAINVVPYVTYPDAHRNEYGETHLIAAARKNNLKLCERLIGQGADVNACTPGGWTPLHWASYNGNVPLITYLLGLGALRDVNIPTKGGYTALHLAARYGTIEGLERLLEDLRVHLDAVTEDRTTAKELALQNLRKVDAVKALESARIRREGESQATGVDATIL